MGNYCDIDKKNKLSGILDSFSKDDLSDAFICSNVRNILLCFFQVYRNAMHGSVLFEANLSCRAIECDYSLQVCVWGVVHI